MRTAPRGRRGCPRTGPQGPPDALGGGESGPPGPVPAHLPRRTGTGTGTSKCCPGPRQTRCSSGGTAACCPSWASRRRRRRRPPAGLAPGHTPCPPLAPAAAPRSPHGPRRGRCRYLKQNQWSQLIGNSGQAPALTGAPLANPTASGPALGSRPRQTARPLPVGDPPGLPGLGPTWWFCGSHRLFIAWWRDRHSLPGGREQRGAGAPAPSQLPHGGLPQTPCPRHSGALTGQLRTRPPQGGSLPSPPLLCHCFVASRMLYERRPPCVSWGRAAAAGLRPRAVHRGRRCGPGGARCVHRAEEQAGRQMCLCADAGQTPREGTGGMRCPVIFKPHSSFGD